jgi:hypothetical protein
MRSKRIAKWLLCRQTGFIGGLHIKIDKALTLRIAEMKIPSMSPQISQNGATFATRESHNRLTTKCNSASDNIG